MGLKEKKAMRNVERWLPQYAQDLQDVTGKRIAFEVDFDSFGGDISKLMAMGMEGARGVVPDEVVTAFQKMIESDGDMAREAISEQVDKVVVHASDGNRFEKQGTELHIYADCGGCTVDEDGSIDSGWMSYPRFYDAKEWLENNL